MEMSPLTLMELQVEALYTHDAAGRIVAVNEPDGGPAPRLFLGRTQMGNVWRIRHDVPEGTARYLAALASGELAQDDLRADPRNMLLFVDALVADGSGIRTIWSGPAYAFPDALPSTAPDMPDAPEVTRITRSNLHLLHAMREMGWDVEALAEEFEGWEPMFALVHDGAAVSLCSSARLTDRAAEAGVQTLPDYRGRGYAPLVVSAWARAIRASGRVPLYSTSWDNLASQAVARKLGLIQYGADLSFS